MTEKLTFFNNINNGKGTSVQQMPDFTAALTDYRNLLEKKGVPLTDINRLTENIEQSNRTRQMGNNFINLVNEISRSQSSKAS